MDRRTIALERLTPAAFAPFGRVLQGGGGATQFARPLLDVWTFAFASDAPLRLQVMRYHRQPWRLHRLERHLAVTEGRLALGASRAILVVAGDDAALPDPDSMRAFLLDCSAGVLLRAGVWHGLDCLPVEGEHADFLFLSDEATEEEIERLGAPVSGIRTEVVDYSRTLALEVVVADPLGLTAGAHP